LQWVRHRSVLLGPTFENLCNFVTHSFASLMLSMKAMLCMDGSDLEFSYTHIDEQLSPIRPCPTRGEQQKCRLGSEDMVDAP